MVGRFPAGDRSSSRNVLQKEKVRLYLPASEQGNALREIGATRHEHSGVRHPEKDNHLVHGRPHHRGIAAYTGLGKLEDPSFTIKTAVVKTAYPSVARRGRTGGHGIVIESAIQQLGQVDKVRSLSQEGASVIYVDIKDTFTGKDLPQIWDELQRKVGDVQRSSPPERDRHS